MSGGREFHIFWTNDFGYFLVYTPQLKNFKKYFNAPELTLTMRGIQLGSPEIEGGIAIRCKYDLYTLLNKAKVKRIIDFWKEESDNEIWFCCMEDEKLTAEEISEVLVSLEKKDKRARSERTKEELSKIRKEVTKRLLSLKKK